jgi:hypothetical protein
MKPSLLNCVLPESFSRTALPERPARSDEVLVETEVSAGDIGARLANILFPMVAAICERFGVVGLTTNRIEAEAGRLLKSRCANQSVLV